MTTKLLAGFAVLIAGLTTYAAYTQRSALVLREQRQEAYWPRHNTYLSGSYSRSGWIASPTRQSYGGFRGGGPGAGK